MDVTTGNAEKLIDLMKSCDVLPKNIIAEISESVYESAGYAAADTEKMLADAGIRVCVSEFDGNSAVLASAKSCADMVSMHADNSETLQHFAGQAAEQNIVILADNVDDTEALSLARKAGITFGSGRYFADDWKEAESHEKKKK